MTKLVLHYAWKDTHVHTLCADTYKFQLPLKKTKGEKVIKRNIRVTDPLHYITVSVSAPFNVHYQEGSVCVFRRQREESMMLINGLKSPFLSLSQHFTPPPPQPPFSLSLLSSSTILPQLHTKKAKNLGRCEELRDTGWLKRARTEGSVKFGEKRWRDVKRRDSHSGRGKRWWNSETEKKGRPGEKERDEGMRGVKVKLEPGWREIKMWAWWREVRGHTFLYQSCDYSKIQHLYLS